VLKALAAAAALASVVVAVGLAVLALGPLPSRRGTAEIPRLSAPVEVRYDRAGIPHVRAILETDAWRALGWIHASDRLFQMELRRRAASGRLAEILGDKALAFDREARLAGYRRDAARDFEQAGDVERAALIAYAEGVNAYLAEEPLPLEMRALGIEPDPWSPVDSLAFGRLLSEGLTMSAAHEQAVFDDAVARGLEAAVRLADASDGIRTVVADGIREALSVEQVPDAAASSPPREAAAGSNAWALSGRRTASGKPLLAGDPHLDPERPGVWYAAHLTSADGLDVAGLTLPGAPGVIIGHNGRVAWSVTMTQADDADLFLEKVRPADGTWLDDGVWVPLARAVETIHVKDEPDVRVEILATRHGPLVEKPRGGGLALARARAWSLPETILGIAPFLAADRAKDGESLRAAWRTYHGPPINVCWADDGGRIGVEVAGSVPRRPAGDGRFPVPGWTRRYEWNGVIAPAELPEISDPPEGYVATANDDWSAAGRRLPFPGLYASPDRVERARAFAAGFTRAGVADMRAMQNDVVSPYALRIVKALGTLRLTDPRAVKAVRVLAAWDGRALKRGPSRLFFEVMRELRDAVVAPAARGTSGAWASWSLLERLVTGSDGDDLWNDPGAQRRTTRREVIERCLARALDTVEREGGTNPARWSWGSVHRLTYPHLFAAALPALLGDRLRLGPIALPGEWHTLSVAGFTARGGHYDVTHIPSARLIVDLGDPDLSRLVLPLGQSGQIFDAHAADQMPAWAAGRDLPFPFTPRAVDAAAISRLRFVSRE